MTLPLTRAGSAGAKRWVGFTAMSIGMFMAILDIQIVASSLPDIQAGLGIALNQLSWVQTAYLIAEIVAIPLTGWLTRVMSTRGAFLACICGFTAASLACAGSNSFWSLVLARVLQGFCGGALIPLVFSAIFLMFEGLGRSRIGDLLHTNDDVHGLDCSREPQGSTNPPDHRPGPSAGVGLAVLTAAPGGRGCRPPNR